MKPAGRDRPCQPSEQADFYPALLGLRGKAKQACLKVLGCPEFQEMASDLAMHWRTKLRVRQRDPLSCRQRVLGRVIVDLVKKGDGGAGNYALALAVALAMTDRAHAMVEQYDAEQRRRFGAN
ncbi:MAG: hypothetical protein RIR25_833 [Verrucomicrobiota bacterium]